jgi:pSer/pThr/pTyr-binding forkhead associated (FHA) protein
MSETRLEFNDEQGRRVIRIEKDLFTIGRRAENDLQLTGKEVSREHAEIFTQNGKFVLRDKESRYGTFVNGERITGDRILGLLDRIRFGGSDPELLLSARRLARWSGLPISRWEICGRCPPCWKGSGP